MSSDHSLRLCSRKQNQNKSQPRPGHTQHVTRYTERLRTPRSFSKAEASPAQGAGRGEAGVQPSPSQGLAESLEPLLALPLSSALFPGRTNPWFRNPTLFQIRSQCSSRPQRPRRRRGRQVTQGSLEPTGRRWVSKVERWSGRASRRGEPAGPGSRRSLGASGRNRYSLCVRLRSPGDVSRAWGTFAFPVELGPRGFSLQPQPSARRGTRRGGPGTRDAGRSPPSSTRPGQHRPRSPARFVEGAMPALTAGLASPGLPNRTARCRSPADGSGLPLQGCLRVNTRPQTWLFKLPSKLTFYIQ